jgi:hypothetical protein
VDLSPCGKFNTFECIWAQRMREKKGKLDLKMVIFFGQNASSEKSFLCAGEYRLRNITQQPNRHHLEKMWNVWWMATI